MDLDNFVNALSDMQQRDIEYNKEQYINPSYKSTDKGIRTIQEEQDVSKFTIDELLEYMKGREYLSWGVLTRASELWESIGDSSQIDNTKYIKQLTKQVKYSKNPMEVKRLNQEIMELQREENKKRRNHDR